MGSAEPFGMGPGKRRAGGRRRRGRGLAICDRVGDGSGDASPVDGIIDGGAHDVLAADDPVAAEVRASQLLGALEPARLQARLAGLDVPPFEEAILDRCEKRGDRKALVVAASLAAVLPPPLGDRARQSLPVSSDRPAARAGWARSGGRSRPGPGWRRTCWVIRSRSSSASPSRTGPGMPSSACSITTSPVRRRTPGSAPTSNEVVAAWASTVDDLKRIHEVPVDSAPSRLREAVTASEVWNGDVELRTDEFAHHRAVVSARLRRAGYDEPPRRPGGDPVRAGPPRRRLPGLRSRPRPPNATRGRCPRVAGPVPGRPAVRLRGASAAVVPDGRGAGAVRPGTSQSAPRPRPGRGAAGRARSVRPLRRLPDRPRAPVPRRDRRRGHRGRGRVP
ncbi:MAG: hypothetical protein AVDCRST_MAG76-1135 [uncultured Acidimicrobiales bacterium]|uniref:Uncharacterized protein n=1 Tax=uncultured Acidimicrobiales bacterium TaxID=310071 RepID=A0A6J4HNJ0_9ACTN|nr:MAG: hypothetical protein AVDCRST_MAG76-1135 [uncultured Acidimicrobiales bacterium]